MTIKVSKKAINLREKLNELDFDRVPFQKMPAGSVVQVVSSVLTASVSTNSATYITTGLEASITPRFSSSKILIMMQFSAGITNAGYRSHFRIGGTVSNSIGDTGGGAQQDTMVIAALTSGYYNHTNGSITFLDSPATTSLKTYRLDWKSTNSSATIYLNRSYLRDGNTGNTISTITLMEIAQ